jgi:FkbM family methyltransferase
MYHAYQDNWGYDTEGYFEQNKQRVDAVANMLADKKSKQIYRGIIKYRQTHLKRDFPFHIVRETHYFPKEIKLGENEVFIDCGASGHTIDFFIKHCPKYKQIIAFEPDTENYSALLTKHGKNPKICLYNAGVYDKDGEVSFVESQDKWSSHISAPPTPHTLSEQINLFPTVLSEQSRCITVHAIDNLNLPKVTYIKMDIEGAEMNARNGAEKTILRDKPKLAISIYHSLEDMLRIPEYIHKLVPEYKLYIRHYGCIADTILYGVIC